MGRVFEFFKVSRFALGSQFHLDNESAIVHSNSFLFRNIGEAIVLGRL